MDEEPRIRIWFGQAIRYVGKAKKTLCALLESVYSGRTRSFFHLSVLMLIALASFLWEREPLHLSLSVDVSHPTIAPTAPPHVAVSAPVSVRGAERQTTMPESRPVVSSAGAFVQNLVQAPVPHTIIPERPRRGVITYTVQSGDNVFVIAGRFGLQHETIIWSNEELETDPDMLYIGQVLNILPVDGIYHMVQEGETLEEIAQSYKVQVEDITNCEYNGFEFDDPRIRPAQRLIVPGGVKPFKPHLIRFYTGPVPKDAPRGDGDFVWPVGGYISQRYWNLHRAIDIAGRHGDDVVAADSGIVVYSAWERSGYGNLVIVDHGNGYVSYYAHLYGFYVDVGERVERGQLIGARGDTGRSTGPHLHFEIRHKGLPRNPLGVLPKE